MITCGRRIASGGIRQDILAAHRNDILVNLVYSIHFQVYFAKFGTFTRIKHAFFFYRATKIALGIANSFKKLFICLHLSRESLESRETLL